MELATRENVAGLSNVTIQKRTPSLREHISSTYFGLRIGLSAMAMFPIILPAWAGVRGIGYQTSLSAYYHARGQDGESVRDGFVGILFAVGAMLYLYKGYRRLENVLLNFAGALVVGVALFPMIPEVQRSYAVDEIVEAAAVGSSWHGAMAVAFFLCIAAVCLLCSRTTLPLVADDEQRAKLRKAYGLLGAAMILAPLAAAVMSILWASDYLIIAVESLGVVAFGLYWLIKTIELKRSNVEARSLMGSLDWPLEANEGVPQDSSLRKAA
jgi:hypothetical protein